MAVRRTKKQKTRSKQRLDKQLYHYRELADGVTIIDQVAKTRPKMRTKLSLSSLLLSSPKQIAGDLLKTAAVTAIILLILSAIFFMINK